jgi:hypothetical protein
VVDTIVSYFSHSTNSSNASSPPVIPNESSSLTDPSNSNSLPLAPTEPISLQQSNPNSSARSPPVVANESSSLTDPRNSNSLPLAPIRLQQSNQPREEPAVCSICLIGCGKRAIVLHGNCKFHRGCLNKYEENITTRICPNDRIPY